MSRSKNGPAAEPPATSTVETVPVRIAPCSLVPEASTPLTRCPTNLDLATPFGKAMAVAAGSPATLDFDERGVVMIRATHYLIYPDEVINAETGEVEHVARTVLYDCTGATVRTTSESAPHCLHRILQLYSPEEWAAGIPIIVSERRSRRTGRTYHDIRVAIEAAEVGG